MIQFNNLNPEIPYQFLKEKYDEALNAGQRGIEAISISSFNKEISEVDSRYVNLKIIISMMNLFFLVIMTLLKHLLSIPMTK